MSEDTKPQGIPEEQRLPVVQGEEGLSEEIKPIQAESVENEEKTAEIDFADTNRAVVTPDDLTAETKITSTNLAANRIAENLGAKAGTFQADLVRLSEDTKTRVARNEQEKAEGLLPPETQD